MSVFWLGYQYALFGLADMFTLVGLLEFFYAESSAGMKSLSTAISWCSLAIGYFLSSVVVEVVNKASGGWLANNNLNRDELNYFYCYKKVELVNQEQNYDDSRAAKGKQLEMVTV
ncbi:hypothetical protein PTKIN_Ptkin09bG0176100 [Pterospermum kingtungense]